MFSTMFGIEIELTGITRQEAAAEVAYVVGGIVQYAGGYYDTYHTIEASGRTWKVMYDSSIKCQKKVDKKTVSAGEHYSVELVSPILTYYQDIVTLQKIIRRLRAAGGFTNRTCGIHVHLDGSEHSVRSLWNFVNLVASRNNLFYKAFQIPESRQRYCKKMDKYLVTELNRRKPSSMKELEDIWYAGYGNKGRHSHYHSSRYHFLNLHSYFHGNKTVELRGFNSSLHAGKVRAYIVFSLAINHQALTQRFARYHPVQEDNEKFAMRVYLVRIGLSGDEFKACREHLYLHLNGNAAWRYGSKENCRSHRAPHKKVKPELYLVGGTAVSGKAGRHRTGQNSGNIACDNVGGTSEGGSNE